MILIPILVGLYFILTVGSYKLIKRYADKHNLFEGYPKISVFVGIFTVASMWPISVTWTLIREALR